MNRLRKSAFIAIVLVLVAGGTFAYASGADERQPAEVGVPNPPLSVSSQQTEGTEFPESPDGVAPVDKDPMSGEGSKESVDSEVDAVPADRRQEHPTVPSQFAFGCILADTDELPEGHPSIEHLSSQESIEHLELPSGHPAVDLSCLHRDADKKGPGDPQEEAPHKALDRD